MHTIEITEKKLHQLKLRIDQLQIDTSLLVEQYWELLNTYLRRTNVPARSLEQLHEPPQDDLPF
jgi:hypothetical protein